MKHIQAPLFFPDPYLSRHISHLTQIFVRRKSMSAEKLLSVLSYVQLLFHSEVSNFPFLSNSRKGHGKLIRRKLLCSLLIETSNQPSWASFAGGELRLHLQAVPSSKIFPAKHKHAALLVTMFLPSQCRNDRGKQRFTGTENCCSLVFLHSHLEPDLDPKSFIQINKSTVQIIFFGRLK